MVQSTLEKRHCCSPDAKFTSTSMGPIYQQTREEAQTSGQLDESDQIIPDRLLASQFDGINSITEYVLKSTGKSIRAKFCDEICRALNPKANVPLTLVQLLELMQYFTLIHDDIIDKSEVRRGHPSLWKEFGQETSLLYGDFMHAKVFEWLSKTADVPDEHRNDLLRAFAQASREVQEGQLTETLNRYNTDLTEHEYNRIAMSKTSSMIFLAAFVAWRFSSRAESLLPALRTFAENFGIAFQIYNDIADFQLGHGKDTSRDLLDGKMTLPVILHLQASFIGDPVLVAYKNRDVELESLPMLIDAIEDTESFARAVDIMKDHLKTAQCALQTQLGGHIPRAVRLVVQQFLEIGSHQIKRRESQQTI